jgi:flagellar hook-associated protein 2
MVTPTSSTANTTIGSQVTTALGYGSGINISQLVTALVSSSQQPQETLYDSQANSIQKKVSGVSQVLSDFTQLSTSLTNAVAQGILQSQVTVGDGSVVSASVAPGARLAGYSGTFEVSQLAQSQSIYSGTVMSATAPIGQGVMTLAVGGQSYSVIIDSSNDSLNGLAATINATGSGVSANVVGQGNGMRLVLKGLTGAGNAFTLTSSAGNPAGLSTFAYDGTVTSPMTLAKSAQDANFTLDGVPYTRESNSFSDLIPNVTFNLNKTNPGVSMSVSVTRPTSALSTALNQFVIAYNQLKADIAIAQKDNPGDSLLRGINAQISGFLQAALTSDPSIKSLNDLGVKSNRDGTISLDTAQFNAILTAHPELVEAIFSPTRDASHTATTDLGLAGAFANLTNIQTATTSAPNTYIKLLNTQNNRVAAQRAGMEKRMADYQARLTKKFGVMDATVGAIKASQAYLTQQVALWSKPSN